MKSKNTSFFYNRVLFTFLFTFTLMSFASAEDWTQKADMPIPRLFFSTTGVAGKLYTIGGMLAEPVDFVDAYDPDKDAWEQKAPLPAARAGIVTCVVDEKIYAIGGWNGQSPALGTVEEYDPATDTWTKKADMPTPRSGMTATSLDGIIYLIGGTPAVQGLCSKPLKHTIRRQIHGRRKQRCPHHERL